MATEVLNRQKLARIDKRRVQRLADATLAALDKNGWNLTVAFVDDRSIRELNRRFRGKDRATDVLSFTSEVDGESASVVRLTGKHLGDIVISAETARKQAREASHSLAREIDELAIHGVLHLCGYDHESDDGEMNRLELRLRRELLSK